MPRSILPLPTNEGMSDAGRKTLQGGIKAQGVCNERKDAQSDGMVLHETDVEPVRTVELDIRTYKGLGLYSRKACEGHAPASNDKHFS